MKIIPNAELLELLRIDARNYYSVADITVIFEKYGDDYYVNPDNHSELIRTNRNKRREKVINAAKTQQGGSNAGQHTPAFSE